MIYPVWILKLAGFGGFALGKNGIKRKKSNLTLIWKVYHIQTAVHTRSKVYKWMTSGYGKNKRNS